MPVNYSYDFVEVLLFQSPQAPTNPVPIKVALPECHAHICESNGEGGTTRHRLKLAAAGICSMADGISALAGSACWLPRNSTGRNIYNHKASLHHTDRNIQKPGRACILLSSPQLRCRLPRRCVHDNIRSNKLVIIRPS